MTVRTRCLLTVVAAVLSLLAAGCGEQASVTVYKQGQYQGKPDTQPWANPEFKNDRATWEKAILARTKGQDEYQRVAAGN